MRTYKFKLYRSKKNKHLHRRIDIAGQIWNHALALYRRYYKLTGKNLSKYDLMKHIAKLKKLPKYSHWALLDAQAAQDVIDRIDRSYKLFFRNLKAGIKITPPKFKKVKHYSSFTLKQTGYKLLGGNLVKIQGIVYKFSKSRDIPTDIKTVTVKRDAIGDLYLYFVVEQPIDQNNQTMTGNSAGFDFGLKTFLTTSDGTKIESPLYYHHSLDELRKAGQNLSSKVKGSSNWRKAKDNLNRVYQSVVNKRRDWFFKLAHDLTNQYDQLFFEDLAMKGMQKLWGRKVGDLAHAAFMGILQYVASTKNKVVQLIARFFPSSKTCHCCGYVYQALQLSERHWVCPGCGVTHDRDHNAALNIQKVGASTFGVGDVRPSLTAIAA